MVLEIDGDWWLKGGSKRSLVMVYTTLMVAGGWSRLILSGD